MTNWRSKKRVGLVLGGGVARGLVHAGVLQALDGQGIPIDLVVGTSAGALAGAIYCAGVRGEELEAIVRRLRWRGLASPLPFWRGQVGISFRRLEAWVDEATGAKTFADLQVPLAVVTTDLMTGEAVVYQEGPLAIAVHASAAVPGSVAPVRYGERLLVDGGLSNNLPISIARRMGADVVIAVNCFPPPQRLPEGIAQQGTMALSWLLIRAGDPPHSADVLVEPDLEGVSLFALQTQRLVRRGAVAMVAQLPHLRACLEL